MPASETRGHRLLSAWLIDRYGAEGRRESKTRPGSPHFACIRAFVGELNTHVPEGMAPLKKAHGVYDWLAGSRRPTLPGRHWRPVIERMSGGAVPASAWGEMGRVAA